ncbi:hypothetical protein UFOVP1439_44 [uncultured Caudovirales phage]|uniref:Uncharacterized protein n=1 Tax=uncultured Caudovirales phage TaxID=2100421 RepID=A0A6J5QMT7_9CAUD|nr:hypothetical protein UFOVP1085_24 [uncultured Caudovirales phage]CAB4212846.1 hypothetical protein UFOVP1439_44 [uncultured Caudovirales phage]
MSNFAEVCIVCSKKIKWMEPGTCQHENGLGHHLACTLTPTMEEEIINGVPIIPEDTPTR